MFDPIARTLDTRGLNCPLPILKTKKALSELPNGAVLELLATDPGAVPDVKAFCNSTRNTLVEHTETAGVFRFLIRRTA